MSSMGAAKFAVVIMVLGVVAVTGTNIAFAQQASCGANPYQYVACGPSLPSAQMYGVAIVGGVVALAIGCGAAGVKYHTAP